MSILIVDDSEVVRQLISDELEKHSLKTKLATNGKEALDILKNEEISLVFLDIHMPEVDGVEFLKLLKQEGITTPCVVVSNEIDIDCTVECRKLGAKGWLAKPIKKDTLIQVYERLVEEKEKFSLF